MFFTKIFKKVIATGVLLSTLSLPMMAQAALKTISVGNGSFSSYASADYLGASVKSVTGIATAKSNIAQVSSKATSSATVTHKTRAHSYSNSLSSQVKYTVTNTGRSANGVYKADNQSV